MEARAPEPVEDLEGAGGVAFVDRAGEVVGSDPAGLAQVRLEFVDVDPGALAVGGPEHVEEGGEPARVVAFSPVGPRRQGEFLQRQARVVVPQQFGDERFGDVGPEAGVVAEDEVDGRGVDGDTPSPGGAHRAAPGLPVSRRTAESVSASASAWASRSRSTRRTTRTVPAPSWTRTIRHPWLTP